MPSVGGRSCSVPLTAVAPEQQAAFARSGRDGLGAHRRDLDSQGAAQDQVRQRCERAWAGWVASGRSVAHHVGMPRWRAAALLSIVLLAAAGCSSVTPAPQVGRVSPLPELSTSAMPSAPSVASYFSPPPPYPGLVWRRGGVEVDPNTGFDTIAGPAHCRLEGVVMLMGPWPFGGGQSPLRQYVRDPQHVLPNSAELVHGDRALLPPDAQFTGFAHDHLQLWTAASDSDRFVYLVSGGDVERWPRVEPPALCA